MSNHKIRGPLHVVHIQSTEVPIEIVDGAIVRVGKDCVFVSHTDNGNIALLTGPVHYSYLLRAVTVHFSAVWNNDVTVYLDANDGPVFDTVLCLMDATGGVRSMLWFPEDEVPFEPGDRVGLVGVNPAAITWGARIVTEVLV